MSRPDRRDNLVQLGLLQIGAAGPLVSGSLDAPPWVGIALGWSAWLVALVVSRRRLVDLRLAAVGCVLGTAGEGLAVGLGLMRFVHPLALGTAGWVPPSWGLVGMATGYVMRPLRRSVGLAVVVGAALGGVALGGAVAAGEIVVAGVVAAALVGLGLGGLVAGLCLLSRGLDPDHPRG